MCEKCTVTCTKEQLHEEHIKREITLNRAGELEVGTYPKNTTLKGHFRNPNQEFQCLQYK